MLMADAAEPGVQSAQSGAATSAWALLEYLTTTILSGSGAAQDLGSRLEPIYLILESQVAVCFAHCCLLTNALHVTAARAHRAVSAGAKRSHALRSLLKARPQRDAKVIGDEEYVPQMPVQAGRHDAEGASGPRTDEGGRRAGPKVERPVAQAKPGTASAKTGAGSAFGINTTGASAQLRGVARALLSHILRAIADLTADGEVDMKPASADHLAPDAADAVTVKVLNLVDNICRIPSSRGRLGFSSAAASVRPLRRQASQRPLSCLCVQGGRSALRSLLSILELGRPRSRGIVLR
jgi:hypothetical protein